MTACVPPRYRLYATLGTDIGYVGYPSRKEGRYAYTVIGLP